MPDEIRRRFIRWQISQPAKVTVGGAVAKDCLVKDISLKGLQVSLDERFESGKPLHLKVALDEEIFFDVDAWPVWEKNGSNIHTYGVYFTRISDKDKDKIYQFVKNMHPEQIKKVWWEETLGEKKGTDAKMEDRRIFARFPLRLSLRVSNEETKKEATAETVDISARGIGLVSQCYLPVRSPVDISLEIPNEAEPYRTKGEVMWSSTVGPGIYRMGINLEQPDLMGVSRILRMAS